MSKIRQERSTRRKMRYQQPKEPAPSANVQLIELVRRYCAEQAEMLLSISQARGDKKGPSQAGSSFEVCPVCGYQSSQLLCPEEPPDPQCPVCRSERAPIHVRIWYSL